MTTNFWVHCSFCGELIDETLKAKREHMKTKHPVTYQYRRKLGIKD